VTETSQGDIVFQRPIQVFDRTAAGLVELLYVGSEPSLATESDALDTLSLMEGLIASAASSLSGLSKTATLLHDLRGWWTAQEGDIDVGEQDASSDDLSIESAVDTTADEDTAVT
jgi:hypothetical protein